MDSSIIYRFLFILFIFTSSQVKAIEFQGKFIQGHFIKTWKNKKKVKPWNAEIIVDKKKKVKVSKDGVFVMLWNR